MRQKIITREIDRALGTQTTHINIAAARQHRVYREFRAVLGLFQVLGMGKAGRQALEGNLLHPESKKGAYIQTFLNETLSMPPEQEAGPPPVLAQRIERFVANDGLKLTITQGFREPVDTTGYFSNYTREILIDYGAHDSDITPHYSYNLVRVSEEHWGCDFFRTPDERITTFFHDRNSRLNIAVREQPDHPTEISKGDENYIIPPGGEISGLLNHAGKVAHTFVHHSYAARTDWPVGPLYLMLAEDISKER